MSRLSRFLRRAGLTLAAVGVVGAVVGSVWYRRAYTIPPLSPDPPAQLPSPNGYDTLRAAVKLLVKEKDGVKHAYEVTRKTKQPLVGRRKLLAANAPVIATVRRELSQEVLAPPNGSEEAGLEFHKLARMLASSSETCADADDLPEAARCGADAVELGIVTPRGGNLIRTFVGNACEAIGDRTLWTLVDRLDAATARATTLRLERIEARRWPLAETLRVEERATEKYLRALFDGSPTRAWRNTGGLLGETEEEVDAMSRMAGMDDAPQTSLQERVRDWAQTSWYKTKITYRGPRATLAELHREMAIYINRAESPWDASNTKVAPMEDDSVLQLWLVALPQAEFSPTRTRTETALLRTCLALRAFRLERGGYPESLDELTRGGYLAALPIDPFSPTRAQLLYRRNADGTMALWSVGPDAQDDGGKPIAQRGTDGKLLHRVDGNSIGDMVARIDTR